MITVRLSKEGTELILPESLGQVLGLREGDRVEVQRRDNVLHLQRGEMAHPTRPLTDLARIITSTRKIGSVDLDLYMDKHGYEQVHGCSDL